MPDWKVPDDYLFTCELTPELWAWQFLRRNPEYRKDYAWFIETWRALEADYGVAPDRDFNRWKADARATVPDAWRDQLCGRDGGCSSGGNSGADDERILIECGMGAKWGFYKFPVDPALEFPEIPDQLLWRDQDIRAETVEGQAQPYEIDLRFDLRLSLKEQLEGARRYLATQQKTAREADQLFDVEQLTRLLRRLDAARESTEAITSVLNDGDETAFHADSEYLGQLLAGDYLKLIRSRI